MVGAGGIVIVAGIVMFVVVIALLFLLTVVLTRRYGRGVDPRRLEEGTREIALRDGNAGTPTGGFLPYFGNDTPSPRERLRKPPEE